VDSLEIATSNFNHESKKPVILNTHNSCESNACMSYKPLPLLLEFRMSLGKWVSTSLRTHLTAL
jgi:hypothetical protein